MGRVGCRVRSRHGDCRWAARCIVGSGERERERGGAKGEGVVPARVPALFHGG